MPQSIAQTPAFSRGRVALLDEMRGFFILLMVFYHALYDVVEIFGVNFPFFHSPFMRFMQLWIAGDFVLISGAVSRYSRSNLKRGALVFAMGMVLTVVTWFAMPSQLVAFGVLHSLGACMMLFPAVKSLLDKVHPTLGLFFCSVLFLATYFVPQRLLGFPPLTLTIPDALYSTPFLFPLGFPGSGFYSSDYFPLIPWFFFFCAGACIGAHIRAGSLPGWVYRSHVPWLSRIGRNTIWIYMLHQPVIYGVLSAVFYFSQV